MGDAPGGEQWRLGAPVAPTQERVPMRKGLVGRYVELAELHPAADAAALFALTHGDEEGERVWTYMPYGPFVDEGAMRRWMEDCARSTDPLFFAVRARSRGTPLGMVSFLNIVPAHRRVEVGHLWYAPPAQRTRANTEAVYLLLCEAFDALRYRRVEWKCDALNDKSRAAAQRLGFRYEGLFRQHIVVKGRNRDTAWFAMLDGEWGAGRRRLEQWLYANDDCSLSLTALP